MTALRKSPITADYPSGLTGLLFTGKLSTEILALWNGVITPVGTIGGSGNAITGVCSPPLIAAPVDGQTFVLKPGAANTGAVTVNLDGTGAIALVDLQGAALPTTVLATNEPIIFHYDGTLSKFRLNHDTILLQAARIAALVNSNSALQSIGKAVATLGTETELLVTFTPDTYSKIITVGSGISLSGTNNLSLQARTSGGVSIFTHAITVALASKIVSFDWNVVVDISGNASRKSYSKVEGTVDATPFTALVNGTGSTSTIGQIRVTRSASDTLDINSRIDVYGWKKQA